MRNEPKWGTKAAIKDILRVCGASQRGVSSQLGLSEGAVGVTLNTGRDNLTVRNVVRILGVVGYQVVLESEDGSRRYVLGEET